MCKGRAEEEKQYSRTPEWVVSVQASQGSIWCELCSSRASLYCQADDAFLCRKCDRSVHGANFLAKRHIRCLLCETCQRSTQRYLIGTSAEVLLPTIVDWVDRSQCSISYVKAKCSRTLKEPFLFL